MSLKRSETERCIAAIEALVCRDVGRKTGELIAASSGDLSAAAQSLAHIVCGPLVGMSIDRTHGYGTALFGLGLMVPPAMLAFLFWPNIERE